MDAIAGAQGLMHTVIADYCTGCELCLPPCPVDCIAMVAPPGSWTGADARDAKRRAAARTSRTSVRTRATDRKALIAGILKRSGHR